MNLYRLTWIGTRPIGNPFTHPGVIGYWGITAKNDPHGLRVAPIEAANRREAELVASSALGRESELNEFVVCSWAAFCQRARSA